jgi:hypothetical protein
MLRAHDAIGERDLRAPVRAVVGLPPDPMQPPDPATPPDPDTPDCRGLVATLEIVDVLGFTHVLYAPGVQPPDPAIPR